MIGKETLREHFLTLQPLFKTVKNFKVIVLTPLPRYLWHRCCSNPAHIINSEDENFARDMGSSKRELQIQLRNMIFMRKLKVVSVLNTMKALGIAPSPSGEVTDLDRILALWGPDPVHPTAAAYRVLSEKIADKVEVLLAELSNSAAQASSAHAKRKADPRDPWVSGSQSITKRSERGAWQGYPGRGRGMAPRHPIRGKFRPHRGSHGRQR